MRKKCYRLIFSSLELDWVDLGAHFKNFILNMVVIYQNRSLSWTINKMESEVEKIVAVHFWNINDTLRQYVKCECFFELLNVTVLSVSHLVAFIRVLKLINQYHSYHKSFVFLALEGRSIILSLLVSVYLPHI